MSAYKFLKRCFDKGSLMLDPFQDLMLACKDSKRNCFKRFKG